MKELILSFTFVVENGLESEDTDETKLDDNKNEIDDDLHSSDLCSSSCSDIENQKDDGFHDISGCEIEAVGETEAQKQHTKSDTEATIKNIINHEKFIHGNNLQYFTVFYMLGNSFTSGLRIM